MELAFEQAGVSPEDLDLVELHDRPRAAMEHPLAASDPYALVLSAGTTSGRAKQSVRSMNSMLAIARAMNTSLNLTPADRIFSVAPITQGTGYIFGMGLAFLTGARCDMSDHPVGPDLMKRIDQL